MKTEDAGIEANGECNRNDSPPEIGAESRSVCRQ